MISFSWNGIILLVAPGKMSSWQNSPSCKVTIKRPNRLQNDAIICITCSISLLAAKYQKNIFFFSILLVILPDIFHKKCTHEFECLWQLGSTGTRIQHCSVANVMYTTALVWISVWMSAYTIIWRTTAKMQNKHTNKYTINQKTILSNQSMRAVRRRGGESEKCFHCGHTTELIWCLGVNDFQWHVSKQQKVHHLAPNYGLMLLRPLYFTRSNRSNYIENWLENSRE